MVVYLLIYMILYCLFTLAAGIHFSIRSICVRFTKSLYLGIYFRDAPELFREEIYDQVCISITPFIEIAIYN